MQDLEDTPTVPSPGEVPDLIPSPELEGRRRAAAVLEVLGGARTPAEAADALGISLPTYYLLEGRALEGLVAACEPRPRGRSATPARNFLTLKRENDSLKQDLSRTQALARAIQRAAGVPVEEAAREQTRARRTRRPYARALRAARALTPPPNPKSSEASA